MKTISRYPLEQKKLPFLPSTDLEIVNMFLRPVGQQQHCLGRHAALCGGELATCSPALILRAGPRAAPLRRPLAPAAPQAPKRPVNLGTAFLEDRGEGSSSGRDFSAPSALRCRMGAPVLESCPSRANGWRKARKSKTVAWRWNQTARRGYVCPSPSAFQP